MACGLHCGCPLAMDVCTHSRSSTCVYACMHVHAIRTHMHMRSGMAYGVCMHARTRACVHGHMHARMDACIHMFTCARNTKQRYTPHRETQTQMDRQTQYTCTQHHMVIPVNGSMVNNDPSEVEAKCNTSTQDIKNKTESHSNIYYDNVIVRLYVQTRLS